MGRNVVVGGIVGLIGIIALVMWMPKADSSIPTPVISRFIYADSIIPGGMASKEDAVVFLLDPVIRQHYEGINISKLVPRVLDYEMQALVSYRREGEIYWVRTTIKKGEVVWSDGTHLIRGRCGNLIQLEEPPINMADFPASQLAELTMPTDSNDPTDPYTTNEPEITFIDTPFGTNPPPMFPPVVLPPIDTTTTNYPPTLWWPPIIYDGPYWQPPVVPPPPPVPVPEPNTLILFGFAFIGTVLRFQTKHRQDC
jgi:hypothetical protein